LNTVTHALAPVVICHLAFGRGKWRGKYGLIAIGVAGALPDLLSPHLSLESRMESWSHGLPAWLGFSIIVFALAAFGCRRDARVTWPGRLARSLSFPLAAALSAAYLFHLICDAISGGINWLYPVTDFFWGDYWIDLRLWIPIDVVLMLLAYYLFRIRGHWKARE